MFMRTLFFFILFLNVTEFSQTVKISKVIDSNLFEMTDNSRIKLAGIDMPRLDNPDYHLRSIAEYAVAYSKKKLLRKPFILKILDDSAGVKLVYLTYKFPLEEKNYNLLFLEQGFGKFIYNIDSCDTDEFLQAEQFAIDENKGIWKLINQNEDLIFDREYTATERNDPEVTDSLDYLIATTPKPQFSHVAMELLVSPAVGLLVGLPVGLISSEFLARDGEFGSLEAGVIGWYAGYVIGSSLCTYAIADKTNKKVKIAGTLLASGLGAGFGVIIAGWGSENNNRKNDWLFIAPLLLPLITSAIYVNAIASDKYSSAQLSEYKFQFQNKHLTAADIYNCSKVFEVDILKVSF